MVRFIAVDDSGKITGTVAKPAIEAVAKPLVDAAEARLAPKPVLKTVSREASNANGAADGPANTMVRMVVNLAPKVTRWRLRIKNAGPNAQGSGTLGSVGVYYAATPQGNKALIPYGAPRVVPDFTLNGSTEFISPWVSSTTAPLGNSVDYTISFTITGSAATVMGDALIPIYTVSTTKNGGDSSLIPTLATKSPLSVIVEYEAEYYPQGVIMQLTREEWLAAKTSGALDSSVFYAVTESI